MFIAARRKLTAWYMLILMSVSISFSIVIYKGTSAEIDRFTYLQRVRIERRFIDAGVSRPPPFDPTLVEEVKQRIILVFLAINGTIFIIMGALSYILAGKTLEPIQEMMEEQNRFISDASHELRTPLTVMKSSLEVYARDPKMTLPEAKKVLLDNIDEVNRLQKLSESLLKLSESAITLPARIFTKIHLDVLIAKINVQLKHIAEQRHIQFHITSIPHHAVEGNEDKLMELFTIILDNAIKYSPDNATILISGMIVKKGIELSISDKGIGIDPKDIPKVFDRFYRSDRARSKAGVGGYGLGLSIAKKIIEFHKGIIRIESILHSGTTVLVWLPFNSGHI